MRLEVEIEDGYLVFTLVDEHGFDISTTYLDLDGLREALDNE